MFFVQIRLLHCSCSLRGGMKDAIERLLEVFALQFLDSYNQLLLLKNLTGRQGPVTSFVTECPHPANMRQDGDGNLHSFLHLEDNFVTLLCRFLDQQVQEKNSAVPISPLPSTNLRQHTLSLGLLGWWLVLHCCHLVLSFLVTT